MKKYIVGLTLCLCPYAFATGPSHATLQMTPLSMNEQGALLYRYKIITNPMGGHYLEHVFYGVGFFTDGQFTSLKEQVVDGNDVNTDAEYEKYREDADKFDQWLSSPCQSSDLMGDFTSCNLEPYAVSRLMSVAELRQAYGVDITKAVGYFLLPGKLYADEEEHIYVTYALDGLIVAEFDDFENCGGGENSAPVFIAQGSADEFGHFDEREYGYECVNVTGIIVKE